MSMQSYTVYINGFCPLDMVTQNLINQNFKQGCLLCQYVAFSLAHFPRALKNENAVFKKFNHERTTSFPFGHFVSLFDGDFLYNFSTVFTFQKQITAFDRINMQDFNLLSGGLDDFCDLETDGLSSLDAIDLCSENDLKQFWCESDIQSFDNFLSLSDWEFSNRVDELLEGSVYAGNETKTGDFFDDEYNCDWNMSTLNEEKGLNESVVVESCSADNNLFSINNHHQPSPSEFETTLSKSDENKVKSVSDHGYKRKRSEEKNCDVGDVKRKRRMNKEAAQRYRQRKKMEKLALDAELESLEKRNVDLKASIKELNSRISYISGFIVS
ncbi:Cyclic AMP-dependent transcription factor ATF-5 [Trichinella pseudospiralis]|uniref:Cyclic AMP-dependent transcription factor ATF-5 n=1 Tax=Trichinella pseudospiralis TaxID=6337 RepID=A0A0V1EZG2_TRIPS|nr:Cyclic AMP-dependent transcription factor ATF-5 [Trichinella pseudospiralis]